MSAASDRRPLLALAGPIVLVWAGWLYLMVSGDRWSLFAEHWILSVTMAFGSFIAGATSEGGGAVAFPVMTLLLGVPPAVARDFSLMIQTVGMNAAAFAIFWLRIPVERRALLWGSLGGAAGVILGLEFVSLRPDFAKALFVSLWLAFALALYRINRRSDRPVEARIESFGPRHALLLGFAGLAGGVVSSITGSGLDITLFSILVLRLRLSEKIATPTSVVLMAFNSAVAFFYKEGFTAGGMAPEAWSYWYVCVPIVVIGAPCGAWFIRNRSRLFIAGLLYASIFLQFTWAVYVLRIFARPDLAAFSAAVFLLGALLFRTISAR